MKVKSHNYYEAVNSIGISSLSPALKKGHELIERATKNGTDWKAYQSFQKPFDLQFQAIELLINQKAKPKSENNSTSRKSSEPITKDKVYSPVTAKNKPTKKQSSIKTHPKPKVSGKDVELISPEVAFIRRYASLHNKIKTKEQILSFIRSLQKAIIEKKIRKTSKYANIIQEIQRRLMTVYQKMGKEIQLNFEAKNLERYLKIGGSEAVMPSVRFIKAYINMQGKDMSKEKAKSLFNRIVDAFEKKKLTENDRYFKHIKLILKSLEDYVKQSNSKPTLNITEAQLNGLHGVLKSCGCHDSLNDVNKTNTELAGIELIDSSSPRNTILNSQQVIDLKSHKLGFTGKWLSFIGNPSKGFTAMIYGKPKFGKSYLAIDFAGYLARNQGKVLYVAYEEGFDDTLKQKLEEKNVAHPNLFVSDYLPANLKDYDFVFIDSVNKANLSPEDLDAIERHHPGVSFIYIFQTTKDGNFKGAMEYKHNVDIVIEVPERGIATQYGRYNQGGEMEIFE